MPGKLYLFPSPIADDTDHVFSNYTLEELKKIRFFIVERARTSRRWFSKIKFPVPISDLKILELEKENPGVHLHQLQIWLEKGLHVGLLSEAGTPCIADPGNLYVDKAHSIGAKVVPFVGPNSLILALMASGLNGQSFAFHGYLPIKEEKLKSKLTSLEKHVKQYNQTQIWIETPYRNDRMISLLCKHLNGDIKLVVAKEITGENQEIIALSIKDWNKGQIKIGKQNAVFLIGN